MEQRTCSITGRPFEVSQPEREHLRQIGLGAGYDLTTAELPDDISRVDKQSLLGKTIKCLSSENQLPSCLFRFQKQELEYYTKQQIPLPRVHWRTHLQHLSAKRERISAV